MHVKRNERLLSFNAAQEDRPLLNDLPQATMVIPESHGLEGGNRVLDR
jgi:hypothetical protein